jgi:hypothetical protein
MKVDVVIPTVAGREEHLERCMTAYQRTAFGRVRLIVIRDMDTCGLAWNAGAKHARSDYLHFTADDLQPLDGWLQAAMGCTAQHALPAAVVTDARGSNCGEHWGALPPDRTEVRVGTVPFMAASAWPAIGPSLDGHYFTDNWISHRARAAGWPTVACLGYRFRHHWAQERRGAGMTEDQRMAVDQAAYLAAGGTL